jgi:endothelin-converting enzyme/putative endopeptidase
MKADLYRAAAALCLTACAATDPQTLSAWSLSEATSSGIEPTLSETIEPGDDFYLFANEEWIETTAVPEGRGSLSELNAVAEQSRERAAAIIEELAWAQHAAGTTEQRIGDLYRSYANEEAATRLGLAPLREGIEAALAVRSHEDVARFMGRIRSHTIAELDVFIDSKNPSVNGIELGQHTDVMTEGVVGLADPDIYVAQTAQDRQRLEAYRAYITGTLQRAGIDRPSERVDGIVRFETRLAEYMWRPEPLRDREANYHKMTYEELLRYAPGFPWAELYRARGLQTGTELVLSTDTAVRESARIFAETSVEDLSSYLVFHWIDNHWDLLSAEFADPGFQFHVADVYGVQSRSPLDARAAAFVEKHLGREVGRLYVQRYFSENDRAKAELMVDYIRAAFREKIEASDWMDEDTRQEALKKLDSLKVNLGYPYKWRDFSKVRIEPDERIGNHARLLAADWDRRRSLLGKPFPDGEWVWGYTYFVDAAITPQLSTITFPAAIIERSMDEGVDPAAAFGEIGMIIGHEMGHAFDDQGAAFDSTGRIRNW